MQNHAHESHILARIGVGACLGFGLSAILLKGLGWPDVAMAVAIAGQGMAVGLFLVTLWWE